MISPLRLENCFIEELTVKANPSFAAKVEERKEGKINCDLQMAVNSKDLSKFKVVLSVSIEPSTEYPALDPYFIQVKLTGFFGFHGELPSKETMQRMISLNGSSILYGIARGQVIGVTASGTWGKYILPALNFVQILEQQQLRKKAAATEEHVKPLPQKRRAVRT